MSDTTIRIDRRPDSTPGTWWWLPGTIGPVVCCPGCQQPHLITLNPTDHTVAADGTVTPSVECARCKWHRNIRLEGWTGGPCA